jgi:hypothetical protein
MDAEAEIADEKFEFSNTLQFDQQQYVELNGVSRGEKQPYLVAGFAVVGVLMLFWSFTLLLGIFILTITGLVAFAPHKLRGTDAWHYRVRPLYQQAILYGVSDQGLRFETDGAEAEIVWAKTTVWEERDDLLRISPTNFPNCWFPIPELKRAGVHDQVMDKCRRYGRQYKGYRSSSTKFHG